MTVLDDRPLVLDRHAQDLLFRDARSANAFLPEPVTDAQLEAIYDLVQWGPTAMNAQPLRILAIRSEAAKARLLPLMSEGNRAKTAAAPVTLVLGYDVDFHDQLHRTFPHAPAARDHFADEQLRHTLGRDNANLQAGFVILAVRAAGLAAGPMGGFDRDGVDAEFFPEGRTRSVLTINVGRPSQDAWVDRLPRLAFDEVVTAL